MTELSHRAQRATENLVMLRSAHKNISELASSNNMDFIGITHWEKIHQLDMISKFIKRIEAILAEEVK